MNIYLFTAKITKYKHEHYALAYRPTFKLALL